MTAATRSARIDGIRAVLDILEANTELPLPLWLDHEPLTFYLTTLWRDEPAAVMSALEAALPCRFSGHAAQSASGDSWYYELDGMVRGMPVRIRARAADVADRQVTGTRVVEAVRWVRRAPTRKVPR